MSDDLRDDLMEIDGVGEATADKILDVLDAHDTTESEESALLGKARAAAESGRDRDAALYLRRDSRDE